MHNYYYFNEQHSPLLHYIDYTSQHAVLASTRCQSLRYKLGMSPLAILGPHLMMCKVAEVHQAQWLMMSSFAAAARRHLKI
jgi:hypothetical protein